MGSRDDNAQRWRRRPPRPPHLFARLPFQKVESKWVTDVLLQCANRPNDSNEALFALFLCDRTNDAGKVFRCVDIGTLTRAYIHWTGQRQPTNLFPFKCDGEVVPWTYFNWSWVFYLAFSCYFCQKISFLDTAVHYWRLLIVFFSYCILFFLYKKN